MIDGAASDRQVGDTSWNYCPKCAFSHPLWSFNVTILEIEHYCACDTFLIWAGYVCFVILQSIHCFIARRNELCLCFHVLSASGRHGRWWQGSLSRVPGPMLNHPRHAWVHTPSSTMLVQSAYEILGLDPTASLDHIKCAYRFWAKKWHPDKNCCDGSTAQFQQVNLAYQTLISCHTPTDHDENSLAAGSGCVESMFNMSLQTKQNTFSITIDITDLMFLVILSECETHHGVSPIDRGVNGQQLRFPYTSPGEPEHYGSISLTFYPTTSRLLVQGSSYLLWVNEHLPAICKQAEHRYMQDASSWTALDRRRGIGLKRDGRSALNLRSSRSSWPDDSIPASAPSLNDPQEKTRESPAAAFGERAALTDGLVPPVLTAWCPPVPSRCLYCPTAAWVSTSQPARRSPPMTCWEMMSHLLRVLTALTRIQHMRRLVTMASLALGYQKL